MSKAHDIINESACSLNEKDQKKKWIGELPVDSNGNLYRYKKLFLPELEWAKICSEINTNYSKYEGMAFAIHMSFGIDGISYWYYFENHGFNEYNIYARVEM